MLMTVIHVKPHINLYVFILGIFTGKTAYLYRNNLKDVSNKSYMAI